MSIPLPSLCRAFCVFVLLLSSSFIATAQQGTVQGRITDGNGQPTAGVSVGLQGTSLGMATDANGDFRIENIVPGTYTLGVRMVGFVTQERVVTVSADQTVTANFVLNPSNQRLQEVVVTGEHDRYNRKQASESLRLGEPLIEAPQNIQVVTSKLLADQQIFNPTEGVTRNVSGVIAPGHWNNVYARITIRGFNSGFGSLRNGMNVGNYFGPLMEDMSFVDRIEFVKGPGGFLMANTEPGGFYNVVTKTPTGTGRKSVGLTLGSFGTYRATTDIDGKLSNDGKLQYRLNLMGQTSDSYAGYEFNNRVVLAPSLRYLLDERTTITAQYTYQRSQFSQAGNYLFSPDGFKSVSRNVSVYDPLMGKSNVNDHSSFFTVKHRFNDNWKVTGQVSYLSYKMRGLSTWVADSSFVATPTRSKRLIGPNVLQRSVSSYDVDNTSTLGQVFVNGNVTTGPFQHRVIVGFDASNKSYDADFALYGTMALDLNRLDDPTYTQYPTSAPATLGTPNRSQSLSRSGPYKGYLRYAGAYVQDELGFFDNRLRLTLAARYSNNYNVRSRAQDDVVTPRVGLSATVAPSTSVYALYDQSFIPVAGVDVNNVPFDPQRGRNTEVGVKRDWMDGRFSSTVTAFNITKTNVLAPDNNRANLERNLNSQIQVGEVRSRGVEVDLTGELLPGLNVVLNYAYLDPEVTKDNPRRNTAGDIVAPSNQGRKLGGAAKHTNNGWLTYRFQQGALRGFGLSGGYQWQLDRYAGLGGVGLLLPDNYFRLDGGISWQNERMNVNLLVNNLTNRYNYSGASYYAGTARTGAFYSWQAEAPTNFRLNIGYNF
ncbi:TonB-dependent receptor [Hymenobacter sp. NBH84]|uniref:TonB-dependent receptor n=1 Tax=Hymenobacter sp. NBH84 TaxID=2596915 RepID=UPI001628E9FC|nr:TonB-dependent receptor [Hymenobacter sp. NBH84]QNE40517.1 TonB-dependent receptor [Hymenobacter sp. NBH84]